MFLVFFLLNTDTQQHPIASQWFECWIISSSQISYYCSRPEKEVGKLTSPNIINLPMVEIKVVLKASSENLNKRHVFPTPESPIRSNLNNKSYVFFAILIFPHSTPEIFVKRWRIDLLISRSKYQFHSQFKSKSYFLLKIHVHEYVLIFTLKLCLLLSINLLTDQ